MEIQTASKEQIINSLDDLSPESLHEVQEFLDFLRFRDRERAHEPAVPFGGLLDGYRFTAEEIARARREMWGRVSGSAT